MAQAFTQMLVPFDVGLAERHLNRKAAEELLQVLNVVNDCWPVQTRSTRPSNSLAKRSAMLWICKVNAGSVRMNCRTLSRTTRLTVFGAPQQQRLAGHGLEQIDGDLGRSLEVRTDRCARSASAAKLGCGENRGVKAAGQDEVADVVVECHPARNAPIEDTLVGQPEGDLRRAHVGREPTGSTISRGPPRSDSRGRCRSVLGGEDITIRRAVSRFAQRTGHVRRRDGRGLSPGPVGELEVVDNAASMLATCDSPSRRSRRSTPRCHCRDRPSAGRRRECA